MCSLPCPFVRWFMKGFHVQGAARERKHRNRLAHPNTMSLQVCLKPANLSRLVLRCFNKVCLNPWNISACVHQQGFDALGCKAAILMQLLAALLTDRLDAAFERDAVSSTEKL